MEFKITRPFSVCHFEHDTVQGCSEISRNIIQRMKSHAKCASGRNITCNDCEVWGKLPRTSCCGTEDGPPTTDELFYPSIERSASGVNTVSLQKHGSGEECGSIKCPTLIVAVRGVLLGNAVCRHQLLQWVNVIQNTQFTRPVLWVTKWHLWMILTTSNILLWIPSSACRCHTRIKFCACAVCLIRLVRRPCTRCCLYSI
jgi:hypothetical protein